MSERVYVWDKFVRVFHWSLVAVFAVSYLTGEDESDLHIYSGYAMVSLVLARILWGFVGTRYARFKDFVKSPRTVLAYARSLRDGNPKHYLGHNPLGGAMVVTMLLTLLLVGYSGLKLYAVEEGKGPLAQAPAVSLISQAYADDDDEHERAHGGMSAYSEADEEFWEEVHEVAVNLMILLVILHVAGVFFSSRVHKEALVPAMWTGFKNKS
jgi:cytochrome b